MINFIKKYPFIYFFGFFFFITFCVNIFFIYISQKTWKGVVAEDSYKKGLNYNEIIRQNKEKNKTD
jgi:nitrogen fixation protein FixH